MRRIYALLIGVALGSFLLGPAMATDGTHGSSGYATKDKDTGQLFDSQHPNHVLVFPGLQTVTLIGHGTSSITAVSTSVATSSNTLRGVNGIVYDVPVTATQTATGTGTGTGTGSTTSTGTDYGGTVATYIGTASDTASYTTPMTATATGTFTATVTVTGTVTRTVTTTGTITVTTTGTASSVGLGTGTISGTATVTATASGTATKTSTNTASATATWTVYATWTKTDTHYLTATASVTATAPVVASVPYTNTETASASSTGSGTWTHTGTTTATQTATRAEVNDDPTIDGRNLIPWTAATASSTSSNTVVNGADPRLSDPRYPIGDIEVLGPNLQITTGSGTSWAIGTSMPLANTPKISAPGLMPTSSATNFMASTVTHLTGDIPTSSATNFMASTVTHLTGDIPTSSATGTPTPYAVPLADSNGRLEPWIRKPQTRIVLYAGPNISATGITPESVGFVAFDATYYAWSPGWKWCITWRQWAGGAATAEFHRNGTASLQSITATVDGTMRTQCSNLSVGGEITNGDDIYYITVSGGDAYSAYLFGGIEILGN